SVTTPGGSGRYIDDTGFLSSEMQTLTAGVADAAGFAGLFPGWKDPGPNAATVAANITATTLKTYEGAITVALNQAQHFAVESVQFAKLEACNSAPGLTLLQAVQCGNEIGLFNAQQTRMSRQLQVTQILLEAVEHGESLNERAQRGASDQVSQLT